MDDPEGVYGNHRAGRGVWRDVRASGGRMGIGTGPWNRRGRGRDGLWRGDVLWDRGAVLGGGGGMTKFE